MALRGRPRIFVTQAEKQKAYRERLKASEALRNSPSVVEEKPENCSELTLLYREAKRLGDRADHNAHMPMWSAEFEAIGFDEWKRRSFEYPEQWWVAHQAWYSAYKLAGFPPGEWDSTFKERG